MPNACQNPAEVRLEPELAHVSWFWNRLDAVTCMFLVRESWIGALIRGHRVPGAVCEDGKKASGATAVQIVQGPGEAGAVTAPSDTSADVHTIIAADNARGLDPIGLHFSVNRAVKGRTEQGMGTTLYCGHGAHPVYRRIDHSRPRISHTRSIYIVDD